MKNIKAYTMSLYSNAILFLHESNYLVYFDISSPVRNLNQLSPPDIFVGRTSSRKNGVLLFPFPVFFAGNILMSCSTAGKVACTKVCLGSPFPVFLGKLLGWGSHYRRSRWNPKFNLGLI